MITTYGTYPWSFVTKIFRNGGDRKTSEVTTSTYPVGSSGSAVSLLAASALLRKS